MNMQLQSQESSSQGQSESITLDKCNSTTDQNIFCKTISPKGIAIPAITIKLRPPEEKKRKELGQISLQPQTFNRVQCRNEMAERI